MKNNDNFKKISNPLTIIGLFAGISEVAGTIVLTFVSIELQKYFIWYVMGFPIFLVTIFFLTLNFNSTVLYAPSDFDDEKYFVELRRMGTELRKVIDEQPEMTDDLRPIMNTYEEMARSAYAKRLKKVSGVERIILDLLLDNILSPTYYDEIKQATKLDDNKLKNILGNLVDGKDVEYAPGNQSYYLSKKYWN